MNRIFLAVSPKKEMKIGETIIKPSHEFMVYVDPVSGAYIMVNSTLYNNNGARQTIDPNDVLIIRQLR